MVENGTLPLYTDTKSSPNVNWPARAATCVTRLAAASGPEPAGDSLLKSPEEQRTQVCVSPRASS
jgi:hypothetical protein